MKDIKANNWKDYVCRSARVLNETDGLTEAEGKGLLRAMPWLI